jgi:hypothetical protein
LLAEKELGSEGVVWGKNTPKADASKSREKTLNAIELAKQKLSTQLIAENSKWQALANTKGIKKPRLPKPLLVLVQEVNYTI